MAAPPGLIIGGLNEAVHVGRGRLVTVTLAVHVTGVTPLFAVRVQVWVDVGDTVEEPLGVVKVPLPRLPVQE